MLRSINKVVKILIYSDLVFFSGWGLVTPIFAIFIVEKIEGGSVVVAGIASAIFWILRSVLRVPMGIYLDKTRGEKDDFWFIVGGFLLAGLVPFGFLLTSLPWHIYLLQALFGLGIALNTSGWTAVFTRHIDKGKESTEWGLDATAIGLGGGIAGAVGGFLVSKFGFELIFIVVGTLGLLGAVLPLLIYKELVPQKDRKILSGLDRLLRRL
jgi:sugar phosphate permease